MVKIDRRAILSIASYFTQPIAHVASSTGADNFSNLTGSFSADRFAGSLWISDKIEWKRKHHSAVEFTPEDHAHSLFY